MTANYPRPTAGDELEWREHDGIEVADQPIPRWWKWIFIATLVFSFPYFAYYHFGAPGRSTEDLYTVAVSENARLQFAEIGELQGDRETLVEFLEKPQWLSVGRAVYRANCASCHGPNGGGLVGPNLTDDHYKNVKVIEDIMRVVDNGAAAGAMPPWQGRLELNERVLVAAYVASLRGTDPGGSGKGPEGAEIPEWPTLEEVQAEQAAREQAEAAATDSEAAADAADASSATASEAGESAANASEAGASGAAAD